VFPLGQSRIDQLGHTQRLETGSSVDQGLAAVAHLDGKIGQLGIEWLAWLDADGLAHDLRPLLVSMAQSTHHFAFLLDKVERFVAVRLEDTNPPQCLARNPAGGDVSDAAILELEPGVGDIDMFGNDRKTDRGDRTDR